MSIAQYPTLIIAPMFATSFNLANIRSVTDNFSSAGEHTHKTYTPQEEDTVRQSRPKPDTSLGSKIISPVRINHGITKFSEVLSIPDTHLVGAYFGMPTSPVSSPGMRSVQPVRQDQNGTLYRLRHD
jgi:hypothetical protein